MNEPIPDDYKKFGEWSELGCKIIKGSKAAWFDGEAFFQRKDLHPVLVLVFSFRLATNTNDLPQES